MGFSVSAARLIERAVSIGTVRGLLARLIIFQGLLRVAASIFHGGLPHLPFVLTPLLRYRKNCYSSLGKLWLYWLVDSGLGF